MKIFIYRLMRDQINSPGAVLLKVILKIISYFYGVLIVAWNKIYDIGLARKHKMNVPVISIGNLTLGGTGKTPFTAYLASMIKNTYNKKVSILIRGYGDDEWKMLEAKLPGINVLKGKDRVGTARKAINDFHSDCIILDDGFQHRRLARDLDILLIDSKDGFGNGSLFPRGVLREPESSAKRADLTVFTKADFGKDNLIKLRINLSGKYKKHDSLEMLYKPAGLSDLLFTKKKELDYLSGKKVVALSAIANPEYFAYMIKRLNATIVASFEFQDHYNYTMADLKNIFSESTQKNASIIVTTEKDSIKIKNLNLEELKKPGIEFLTLEINSEITKNKEKLIARLDSIFPGQRS